jgi:hypothetical protein
MPVKKCNGKYKIGSGNVCISQRRLLRELIVHTVIKTFQEVEG